MAATHKKTVQDDPWMSVLAASKVLGKTRHGVLALALHGEIGYERSAGRIVVARADVERIAAEQTAAA